MKNKILIIIILICFFSFKTFSQSASQSHFFIDTTNNSWHQIEYYQKIKVYTKDSLFIGKLDSISENIIFLNTGKTSLNKVSKIKYTQFLFF